MDKQTDLLQKQNNNQELQNEASDNTERRKLIAEINEQIPFLAYGLSEKIHQNGLQGKVSVLGKMGSSWGIGISKNNPRKDIPNVVIYPESVLMAERAVTNARLRHEIGNLNHSLGISLKKLRKWCEENQIDYRFLLPLVEAVQEASVNYLEMQNSFSNDPAAAFRPLYEEAVDVKDIADKISEGSLYKQAVDLTLLQALDSIGLIPHTVWQTAENNAAPQAAAMFTAKINSVIGQAVKTASPRIKIQLVRDYLWREFSQLISLDLKNETGALDSDGKEAVNSQNKEEETEILQKAIDSLQKQQQDKAANKDQRQEAVNELMEELRQALENPGGAPDFEDLQNMLNPQNNDDDAPLEDLVYKIEEVGIAREKLTENQLDLLERIHGFCRKTTEKYVRTMRFLMKNYQLRNKNFTDRIIEKIIQRHHDTPIFTIYSEDAGNEFLQEHKNELLTNGMEIFQTHSFMLSFNLPLLLGRFGYNRGKGRSAQAVAGGAVDWEHFYLSALPVIWIAVDYAIDDDMLFNIINPPHHHNWKKYFYLYEIINFPSDDFHLPPEDTADSGKSDDDEAAADTDVDDNRENNGSPEALNPNTGNTFDPNSNNQSTDAPNNDKSLDGEQMNSTSEAESSSPNNTPLSAEDSAESLRNDDVDMPETAEAQKDETADHIRDLQEQLADLREQLENNKTEDLLHKLLELLDKLKEAEKNEAGVKQAAKNMGDNEENEEDKEDGELPDSLLKPERRGQTPETRKGGVFNKRDISELFRELEDSREKIKSRFEQDDGQFLPIQEVDIEDIDDYLIAENTSVENLKALKHEQSRQLEAFYTEQSGLSGETLRRYAAYREETKDFVKDLIEFFTNKFSLDIDFDFMQNQWHGNRLQNSWTHKLIGIKRKGIVIEPTIFERRTIPKNTQFVWSVIIDNSASCSGEIIEEEKKVAVALIEVSKQLKIPLEILVFGDSENYTFLKTFDQELYGEQLAAIVKLDADHGTPDVATLNAACSSITDYVAQFNRSYNFVYFMTDGKSGSGSIQSVIRKFRREIVITGIGLAEASRSIRKTWGSNAVGVQDIRELSSILIRKIENQIEDIFD